MSAPGGPHVKPGASRSIAVEMATESWEGKITKEIFIETNDPQKPRLSLTVKVQVYTMLSVEPNFVDFKDVKAGTSHAREVLIRNRRQEPIAITQLVIDPEKMASIAPRGAFVLQPGAAMKLVLTLAPPATYIGPIYGSIILHTDWKDLPQKKILFRTHVIANTP